MQYKELEMETEEHYQKLEMLYHSANIQEFYSDSKIHVAHEKAEILLPIEPKFFHGSQAIHGSVYFKLLDDAAYFAVASLVKDVFIVTSSFQINLIRPVDRGNLKAIGTVRSKARNLFVAEATLYSDKGKEVAFGTGQFMKTPKALTELEGYS
ncbi:PaaI family thioesterase [Pontibacter silvestris]|uniref:PaaI family thioesterase n=1 Tax=Pontibacter silvestris TaxID=2305183 RepID=A0ABW4X4U6_9BACT|nr:PaaI family thioesterase [Pontibacter silvestris]MCC9134975.1 PaaI family thioesterase [Pontibacter silvestris]